MLDRLSTELLALDGAGKAKGFPSYAQYVKHQKQTAAASPAPQSGQTAVKTQTNNKAPAPQKKLTYKLQHELDGMEAAILEAEDAVERLQAESGDPKVMADHARFAKVCEDLGHPHDQTAIEKRESDTSDTPPKHPVFWP